jgi:heme-degrading monooxygenase HmoA
MNSGARILVYYQAPSDDSGAVVRAYHQASSALARIPGLVRNELLSDLRSPRRYAVLSEWEDEATFLAWEQGTDHERQTAPLRPYLSGITQQFGIYTVVAAYP